jgi:hypothetical protein
LTLVSVTTGFTVVVATAGARTGTRAGFYTLAGLSAAIGASSTGFGAAIKIRLAGSRTLFSLLDTLVVGQIADATSATFGNVAISGRSAGRGTGARFNAASKLCVTNRAALTGLAVIVLFAGSRTDRTGIFAVFVGAAILTRSLVFGETLTTRADLLNRAFAVFGAGVSCAAGLKKSKQKQR